MNEIVTQALMIANSLDYDLINRILWLITLLLELSIIFIAIGLAVLIVSIAISLIFGDG